MEYMSEEVEDYVRRLGEFCSIFKIPCSSRDWEEFRLILSVLQLSDSIISQMKLAVNIAFCEVYDQELPETNSGTLGMELFPRTLKLRFKQIKKYRDRRRNWILVYSMFQGLKKGLMPAHPEVVEQNLNKHAKSLSAIKSLPDRLYDRCQELTKEISKDLGDFHEFSWDSPISRKSTYEYNYSEGGNVGFLRDRAFNLVDADKTYKILFHCLRIEQFVGYVEKGDQVYEVRSRSLTRYELLCESLSAREIDFVVSPACILEPMKVRIITKPYQCMHLGLTQLQKWLWSKLYTHKSGFFQLIGEHLNRSHLWPILMEWQPGKKCCSGDYSAATDNLLLELSEMLYCGVFGSLQGSNPRLFERGLKSLTKTRIDYGKAVLPPYPFKYSYTLPEEDVQQTNGQLMGNVISFVFLCLANYILYHCSHEEYRGRKIELWDTPKVLINGDDILFCTDQGHYDIWKNVVTSGGLTPSMGKNFFTDKFLQINSELWVPQMYNGDRCLVQNVEKVPYVNFGLLTQRRKQDCSIDLSEISAHTLRKGVQSCVEDDGDPSSWMIRLRNMSAIRRDLLADLPDSIRSRVEGVFKGHVYPIFKACGLHKYYFGKYQDWYTELVLKKFVGSQKSMALEHFPMFEEEKILGPSITLDWTIVRKSKNGPIQLPFPEKSEGVCYDSVTKSWVHWCEPKWRVPYLQSSFGDGDLEGYLR
jgi:hypothetical protein